MAVDLGISESFSSCQTGVLNSSEVEFGLSDSL